MRKPLYVAAWSGVILAILILFTFILGFIWGLFVSPNFPKILDIFFSLLMLASTAFFYYGFVVLGRKFNAKLLVVMSWIGIVMSIILFLVSIVLSLTSPVSAAASSSGNISDFFGNGFPSAFDLEGNNFTSGIGNNPNIVNNLDLANLVTIFIIAWIVISLVFGAISILWGIGLMKLDKKVKYAKVTGIINIVAGATFIIFIGWLVAIVAYIFEIILLFNASSKFEK